MGSAIVLGGPGLSESYVARVRTPAKPPSLVPIYWGIVFRTAPRTERVGVGCLVGSGQLRPEEYERFVGQHCRCP